MPEHGILAHASRDETDMVSSSIDIFATPTIEVGMESVQHIEVRPISSVNGESIQFNFQQHASNMYLNASGCRLEIVFQILKQSGEALDDDFVGSIVNAVAPSLFESIQMDVNGQAVSELTQSKSHYISYIQSLLSYGPLGASTHMKAQGWIMDQAGRFDLIDEAATTSAKNSGYTQRKADFVTGSPRITLTIPIPHDLWYTDVLFPPNFIPSLKFRRANAKFFMLSKVDNVDVQAKIEDMRIHAPYVTLSKQVVSSHEANFARGAFCSIPMKKIEVYSKTFAAGMRKLEYVDVLTGKMPEAVYL